MTVSTSGSLLTWRPLAADDVPAWARLLAAAEEVDRVEEHWSEDDLRDELADPELDLARDSVAVLDGEQLVAYQIAMLRPDATGVGPALGSHAVVHPRWRGRGIGTALVRRGRDRAADAGATFLVRVHEHDSAAAAVCTAAGMAPVRWWAELRRHLGAPVEAVGPPEGVAVEVLGAPFDHDRWDEPLRLAHNAAFTQHWGSSAVSADIWRAQRTAIAAFRPAYSAAALAGGDVVAYVMSYENPDPAGQGRDLYVGTVGTVPAWRGRGVAGALLARVLQEARAAGFASSTLTVDSDNVTGALGVYTRVGYEPLRRSISWAG